MEILSAKTSITIDGVPGTEVLAACATDGTVTLSTDGQPLADSSKPADDNLYLLRHRGDCRSAGTDSGSLAQLFPDSSPT